MTHEVIETLKGIAPIAEQSESWEQRRHRGIGGSDAAAACGISPWKSRYQLWLEKTADEPPSFEQSEPMRWGTLLEPVIRQRYCDITGKSVVVPEQLLRHRKYQWCIANVDGLTDDDRVFEAKTARSGDGWGEDGSDVIPDYYQTQVQHYMAVTGAEAADVAVLIGASDFRILTVPADEELQSLLIEREAEFWDLVVRRVAPEPETIGDVQLAFPRSKGDFAEASVDVVLAIEAVKKLKKQQSEIEAEIDKRKAEIMAAIGERDGIKDGDRVMATWKSAKPTKRFDTKAFAKAQPDLYSQFLKESEGSRRFLVK